MRSLEWLGGDVCETSLLLCQGQTASICGYEVYYQDWTQGNGAEGVGVLVVVIYHIVRSI